MKSSNPSRRTVVGAGSAILGANFLSSPAKAALAQLKLPENAPETPPPGYNILFVLVDQEHFFDKWPFPVPGREYLKANGTTFLNHQATSQVCSSARSVIYTGSAHPAYGRLRQHGGPLAADRLIPPDGTSPFCFRRLSSLSISALASGGVSGALSGSFS